MPDELWIEVCDIVQETGIKTIPKKKKCRQAKWLSEEALQIAVKGREVKSKGEKERSVQFSSVTQSCPTFCDPWTVAHQALLSMGFSRQEYWSGLPF